MPSVTWLPYVCSQPQWPNRCWLIALSALLVWARADLVPNPCSAQGAVCELGRNRMPMLSACSQAASTTIMQVKLHQGLGLASCLFCSCARHWGTWHPVPGTRYCLPVKTASHLDSRQAGLQSGETSCPTQGKTSTSTSTGLNRYCIQYHSSSTGTGTSITSSSSSCSCSCKYSCS